VDIGEREERIKGRGGERRSGREGEQGEIEKGDERTYCLGGGGYNGRKRDWEKRQRKRYCNRGCVGEDLGGVWGSIPARSAAMTLLGGGQEEKRGELVDEGKGRQRWEIRLHLKLRCMGKGNTGGNGTKQSLTRGRGVWEVVSKGVQGIQQRRTKPVEHSYQFLGKI